MGPDTAMAPLPPCCVANGTGFTCSSAVRPAAGKIRGDANSEHVLNMSEARGEKTAQSAGSR